jgi:hypothetical protein
VAGLAAALVAAEGLEGASGDVGNGESRVPERGFLPRLAADDGAGRCLPLVDGELEGFAGMKVRSWKGEGEAMMAECGWQLTDLPCLDKSTRPVLKASTMARSLSTISPSPGPLSPSFSDDSSSQDGAPSAFLDVHDPAQHVPSRPGSPTRPGQAVNARPPLDVVTCQWEDCGDAFDVLSTFIRHLHEGAPDFSSSLASSFRPERPNIIFF